MKVLLIYPPSLRFAGLRWVCFPSGLGYIAAVLIKEGHTVEIYNADLNVTEKTRNPTDSFVHTSQTLYKSYHAALQNPEHEVWKEVKATIRECDPEVIGISCMVFNLMSALTTARIAKSINRNIVVILGGPAATTCADMILENQNVDFVVRGEGELTMVELLKILQDSQPDFHRVDGLSFRESNKVIHNQRRTLIDDISSLSYPARNSLLYADKQQWLFKSMMGNYLITSRGCPYNCSFCAACAVWGQRKIRTRAPEDIVNEVLCVRDRYGVRRVVFWDDHVITDRQRAIEMCNLLIERKAGVHWVCLIRADNIDEQLLKLMKKAGCFEVQIGVESGSERILKKIRKGITLKQVEEAARMIRQSGLRWHGFFMIGFPGETTKEMKATMRLVYKLKPDRVDMAVFTPYPGTELFRELEEKGAFDDQDWLYADIYNVDYSYMGGVSREEFRKVALEYFKKCDLYNEKMNKPRPRYMYYLRHPSLIPGKVIEKISNIYAKGKN